MQHVLFVFVNTHLGKCVEQIGSSKKKIDLNINKSYYCNAEVRRHFPARAKIHFARFRPAACTQSSSESRRKFTLRVPRESPSLRIVTCFLMSVTAGVIIVPAGAYFTAASQTREAHSSSGCNKVPAQERLRSARETGEHEA